MEEYYFQNYHTVIFKYHVLNKNSKAKKHQERIAHSKEQNKLTETIPKEAHTLELLDKDFITTILNMPK